MEDTQYALQSIRKRRSGPSGELFSGFMETHTLWFVVSGSGDLYLDGTRHPLKAKAVAYCPPGAIIDIRLAPESAAGLEVYELQVQVWELEERSGNRILFGKRLEELMDSGKLPYAASHEMLALLEELIECWQSLEQRRRMSFRLDAVFKQLLYALDQNSGEQEEDEEWMQRIRSAVEYMRTHFASEITRTDMAKRAGLTPEHFSVTFKRAMGLGFSEYLTRLRMEKTKEALLGSGRTLGQIAREVGYRDGMYLSRKFKQHTGVSPRDYARRPKRLVSLQYLGHLLALGLIPVGTTPKLLQAFPYREYLKDAGEIQGVGSLDEIAALQPDLIVTSRPNSEPLAQLATTISIPWGREDTLDELLRLGKALNRVSEAEDWIAAYREKEKQAAAQVAGIIEPGATAAVFEFWPGRIWAVNMGYGRGLRNIYKTFSFRPPEKLAPHILNEGVGLELPLDKLAEYAADYIFVSVWEESGGAEFARNVMASPEWKELPAVRNGRIYPIDLELFKHNDPIAIEQQLTVQTELLTKVHKKTYYR